MLRLTGHAYLQNLYLYIGTGDGTSFITTFTTTHGYTWKMKFFSRVYNKRFAGRICHIVTIFLPQHNSLDDKKGSGRY